MNGQIEIRRIPFDYEGGIDPVWNPHHAEWSHMVNGASLAMPYLEPFLIRTMREAVEQIDDEALREDARGFIGQEAQHYTNHRRYNEMLKANGYAELADVEARMARDYERLEQRSLAWRLAYSAGFETMTIGITEWLLSERERLFDGADPVVTSLVLWHMVEETEHKTVAFDVFQAVSGNYFLRVLGLLWGSLHVALLSRAGYRCMLQKDGRWGSLRSRARLWRRVGRFLCKAAPAMLRALVPGHDPRDLEDPEWVAQWRAAYESIGEGELPILTQQALRGDESSPVALFVRSAPAA